MLFFFKKLKIYPFFFQIFFFLIFSLLIVSLLSNNDLSSLNTGMMILWYIWWPAIPFLILFTGRLWCSVCPFSSTAIVINKLFPYRILNPNALIQNGFIIALFTFIIIIGIDNIFSIASNQKYTLIFFFSLYSILIIFSILFDYKTYCNVICPFGIIAKLYGRFSFLKIKRNNKICCNYKWEKWKITSLIKNCGSNNYYKINKKEGWRFKLECLKKCKINSAHIEYTSPLKDKSSFEGLKIIEILAPSIIIALFSAYVFLKSNYAANLFIKFQSHLAIDFNIFILLSIMIVLSLTVLSNLFVIYISLILFKVDRDIIYKGFYCLVPILILFHISLVLKDIRGIVSLNHIYPFLTGLEQYLPGKNILRIISYVLICCGIIFSGISFFHITQVSLNSTNNTPFLFLYSIIFCFYSFLTLATIKYSQYFG